MVPGNCQRGQLTKRGAEQHFALGQAFRKLYIEKQHLLHPRKLDRKHVYLRSTDVPRTLQSALNFVAGAFPDTLADVIGISTLDRDTETADPSWRFCPALHRQLVLFEQSGTYRNYRRNKLEPIIEKYAALWNVSSINTNALNDELRGHFCHHFALPLSLNDAYLIEAATRHLKNLVTMHTLRLYVGFFLQDVVETIANKTRRFNLLSAHDTTVRALLHALARGEDPRMPWPPYASHLAFERWRDPSGRLFVVMQHDGRNRKMQYPCKHIFCRFSDFRKLVSRFNVTRQECFEEPTRNHGTTKEWETIV